MGSLKKIVAMFIVASMVLVTPMEVLAAEVEVTSDPKTVEASTTVSEITKELTEAPASSETPAGILEEVTPTVSPEEIPEAEVTPTSGSEEMHEAEATPTSGSEEMPEAEATPTVSPAEMPEAEATPTSGSEETPEAEATPTVSPTVTPTAEATPEASPEATATAESTPSASPAALSETERLESMTPEERLAELERLEKELGLPNVSGDYVEVDYTPELSAGGRSTYASGIIGNDRTVVIPSSYDAREKGLVSSVKDQSPFGSCWSFSVVACAESAYMMLYGEEANLSEAHLVEFFYTADDMLLGPDGGLEADGTVPIGTTELERGGNNYFTTWGLATWAGVADEATDSSLVYPSSVSSSEYSSYSLEIDSSLAYEDALHLENAYWLSTEDPDSIKQAIMEYGTVGISYYHSNNFSSDAYSAYNSSFTGPAVYYNPTYTDTNHAVALVGWDDNFDKNNFKYTYSNYGSDTNLPTNNGAWLMKNSWGTPAGDDGYYWISYEDASIQSRTVFAFDFAEADNYDHNYQYDGSTGINTFSTGTTTTTAAVYTANGLQNLEAVGVGIAAADTTYTVEIYTDLTDTSNPQSGTLATTKTGTTTFEGFYTIELDEQVQIEEGETFAVVIKIEKDTGAYLFVDTSYNNGGWISFVAEIGKGETFYKSGSTWYDAASSSFTARIKAYTSDANPKDETEEPEEPEEPDEPEEPEEPETKEVQAILNSMIQSFGDATYTGEEICPKPIIIYDGAELIENEDYSITYSNNQNVGEATVIIAGMGDYTGTVMRTFRILPKALSVDMAADANASGVIETVYTGITYENIKLQYEGHGELEEGKDYTLTYNKVPLEAGSYTATVTGMGNFSGTLKITLKITADTLSEDMVELAFENAEYTGGNITPSVTVLAKSAVSGTANYSVKYTNNQKAGTATVTVTGKKSLTGKVVKSFTITPKDIDADSILVTVADAKYSGKELTPKVTVKDGNKTLSAGKDYTLTYENNINATIENEQGEISYGKVIVTGLGNYQGSNEDGIFEIAPAAIKSGDIKVELRASDETTGIWVKVNNVVLSSENYTLTIKEAGTDTLVDETDLKVDKKYDVEVSLCKNYRGTALLKGQTCKIAVESLTITVQNPETYIYTGKAIKPKIVVSRGNEVISSKNYTVSYANHVNANTAEGSEPARLTVTGKGSFSGSKDVEFTIYPKSLDAAFAKKDSIITDIKAQTYTGSAITPKATIKGLKEGADFTVTYADNQDVAYEKGAVAKKASVTVTLSDNYTMSDASKLTTYFQINPAKISSVAVSKQSYRGKGVLVEPEPVVMAGKLVVPRDAYTAVYAGNDKINSKASVIVTATDGGNFTGEKKVTFRIEKEALSKLEAVAIEDITYDGTEKKPELKLLKDGKEIDASNYTLAYSKNKNAGTATVTATAANDSIYSGKVTVRFKILPAALNEILVEGSLPSKTYSGKAHTFTKTELEAAFTEAATGNRIPYGSYKVTYTNNKNAGVATLTLTGSKNYTGIATVSFNIAPKSIAGVGVDYEEILAYDNGNPVLPKIHKVTDGKTKLQEGIDYTVAPDSDKYTKKGTVPMSITGIGNYTGTIQAPYTIQ